MVQQSDLGGSQKHPSSTMQHEKGIFVSADELDELRSRLQTLEDSKAGRKISVADGRQDSKKTVPWIVFLVAINFLLWISMIYSIFNAREYHYRRGHYFTVTWMIFLAPLLLGAGLWVIASLSHWRTPASLHLPRARTLTVLNALNAIACFTFVTVYLYYSAIPQYNTPKWESTIDFMTDLPLPAFALLVPTAKGTRLHDPVPLIVPSANGSLANAIAISSNSSQGFPTSAVSTQVLDDHWTAVVFNSSLLNSPAFSHIQDRLYLSMDLSYNSSAIHQDGSSDDLDDGEAVILNFEMFDTRLSLQSVFECEVANYPILPAFAHNTFSINIEYITDEYGLVISPDANVQCGREYHALLAEENPRYATYTWNMESSIPVASNLTESCDVAFNPENVCTTSISISFGSHLVRSMKSMPGISHLEIWLNAGAIAGSIQFFAWFLEILLV